MEQINSVEPAALDLPPCVTPRPGERVVLYQNGRRINGVLRGHTPHARPLVEASTGGLFPVPSFDVLRLEEPKLRMGPNWLRLPASATITRPLDKHIDILESMLARTSAGIRHNDLVLEIWSRGYEVFLIDRTVRDTLAGREPVDLEVATTMPIDGLHMLARCMYGADGDLGEIDRLCGSLRIGGATGSANPAIKARVFPLDGLGTDHALFASSFERDTGYRDFACHCVYYDPVNRVLIDPKGTGIEDALGQRLRTVYDGELRSRFELGRMGLRAAVMLACGFDVADGDESAMAELCAYARDLGEPAVVGELKRLLIEETRAEERVEVVGNLFTVVAQRIGEEFARRHILAYREDLSS